MKQFTTSLLREKFVIQDAHILEKEAVTALSNRMVVELRNTKGALVETYIVRAHNMHLTVRMAARIIQEFKNSGPISSRSEAYKWEDAWSSLVNDYEYAYNPERWIAIYHEGKCVFAGGKHHAFLDLVEKCDADNTKDYDYAIPVAAQVMQDAGKEVRISHDANVALSISFEDAQGRIGVILRAAERTTTFSFSIVENNKNRPMNIPQCLGGAAAFLEGVQLAFLMGMNTEKIRIGIIKRHSKEEKQTTEGKERVKRLTHEIAGLEDAFEVNYRPEKPEFYQIMMDAEQLGQRALEPPPPEENEEGDGEEPTEGEEGEDAPPSWWS